MRTQNLQSKLNTINNWIQRRLDKGIRPNADEISAHIDKLYPTLSPEDKEYIYSNTK